MLTLQTSAQRQVARQAKQAVQFRMSPRVPCVQRMPLRRSVQAQAAGSKVEKISGEELEVTIASRTTPIIVDFFATWCGPCLILAQELEKVANELGDKVKIVKIDVDENPELATMLKIEGLPTVVFIPLDQQKPALRTEGLLPADRIVAIFKENM